MWRRPLGVRTTLLQPRRQIHIVARNKVGDGALMAIVFVVPCAMWFPLESCQILLDVVVPVTSNPVVRTAAVLPFQGIPSSLLLTIAHDAEAGQRCINPSERIRHSRSPSLFITGTAGAFESFCVNEHSWRPMPVKAYRELSQVSTPSWSGALGSLPQQSVCVPACALHPHPSDGWSAVRYGHASFTSETRQRAELASLSH